MTLKEWYDFNKTVIHDDMFSIVILQYGEHNLENKMMEAQMKISDAIILFGDFIVNAIKVCYDEDGEFSIVLWKP